MTTSSSSVRDFRSAHKASVPVQEIASLSAYWSHSSLRGLVKMELPIRRSVCSVASSSSDTRPRINTLFSSCRYCLVFFIISRKYDYFHRSEQIFHVSRSPSFYCVFVYLMVISRDHSSDDLLCAIMHFRPHRFLHQAGSPASLLEILFLHFSSYSSIGCPAQIDAQHFFFKGKPCLFFIFSDIRQLEYQILLSGLRPPYQTATSVLPWNICVPGSPDPQSAHKSS